MRLDRAALYLEAARHATPSQIAGRARRVVPPNWLARGADPQISPALEIAVGLGAPSAPQWGPVPQPAPDGVFTAAGARRTFAADAPAFWSDDSDGLLFLFAIHGFAELARYVSEGERTAAGDAFWSGVVEDWLRRHQRAPRLPGWHPYPTSVRAPAWASALGAGVFPDPLRGRAIHALARQVDYLTRAVERDIGGNHVLKNLTATIIAGAALGMDRAIARAMLRLERECRRQFLADGGHIEKSTSYHREAVHDLSEAAAALEGSGRSVPAWLGATISAGAGWLEALTAPDGSVPLLNDAWQGPPLTPPASPPEVTHLDATGLVVLRGGGMHVVLDVGTLCPPELPPHAHADALSFTLWADGAPVIVDPGAMAYTGPARAWYRSTAAHNTVSVDGRDQCEFWGDFRAGRLPRVRHEVQTSGDGFVLVRGEHDGYRRAGVETVARTFVWAPEMGIVVLDRMVGARPCTISSAIQLAPGATTSATLEIRPIGGTASSSRGTYAPYLGTEQPAPRLEFRQPVGETAILGWSVLRSGWRTALGADGDLLISSPDGTARSVGVGVGRR